MTDAETEARFRMLAGRGLSEAEVEGVLERLWAIDEERKAPGLR